MYSTLHHEKYCYAIANISETTAVLFDQSIEYRYRGTFLDQVPSTGTAVRYF